MKAVTYDIHLPRLAYAKVFGALSPHAYVSGLGPTRFQNVPDPTPHGDDWVLVEPRLTGVCGSDSMQVFIKAKADNPLSAVVSAPHVLGHETVGTVLEAGKGVSRFRHGDRVAISPWLSCATRGLPDCRSCAAGHFSTCEHFFDGKFSKGMHIGNCRDVGGGFAEATSLHPSMLFPIPDAVDFETAVLADPFSVSLHAVLRAPPLPGETVLVIGCGSLGLLAIRILRVLFPDVTILAVDHKPWRKALVERLGANGFYNTTGAALIEQLGERLKTPVRKPFFGLPWLQTGVDRIYDAVGSARTLELGLRVIRPQGSIVMVGVAEPRRFEWTPLYFKEVGLFGSNAYGLETVEGKRAHAIEHFLSLAATPRLALGPMVTHRYPLERFADAFLALHAKSDSQAIKVVFDPKLAAPVLGPTVEVRHPPRLAS